MGAVTAIICELKIDCLILDSGFSDLKKTMQEIAVQRMNVNSYLIDGVLMLIQSKIKEVLNGADIFKTDIMMKVQNIQCPVLFAYATNDEVIMPYHSKTMYEYCRSSVKKIIKFEGGHNTFRPDYFYESVIEFI